MIRAYKFSITYFIAFSILLLISSVMLFELKLGFSAESILRYYRGSEELFIPTKSYMGLLKITLPHIFAFGLFAMVVLHFLVFTPQKDKLSFKILIYLIYITAILEIASPIFIIAGYDSFSYIKLLSFILFEGLMIWVLWLGLVNILP